MSNSKKSKSIGIALNVFAVIGFVTIYIVVSFSNIGLCFSKPKCHSTDISNKVCFYAVPAFLLIDFVIHIILNRKEKINTQILRALLQLVISIGIFSILAAVCAMSCIIKSSWLFDIKSPDNSHSYIVKDSMFIKNNNLTVINKNSSKTESNPEKVVGLLSYCEISWLDNENFNIRFSSNQADSYYAFNAPDKLTLISEDEYSSQPYIYVDKYLCDEFWEDDNELNN